MSGVSYEKEDADTRIVIRAGTLLALVTLVVVAFVGVEQVLAVNLGVAETQRPGLRVVQGLLRLLRQSVRIHVTLPCGRCAVGATIRRRGPGYGASVRTGDAAAPPPVR